MPDWNILREKMSFNTLGSMDIIRKFLKSSWLKRAALLLKDPSKVLALLQKLRVCMTKDGFHSMKEELSMLANYVKDIVSGVYKEYNRTNLLLVVAALIYIVTPLDFIPDFIIGGLIDDVAIIGWIINKLHDEFVRYKEWLVQKNNL